jgi:hypothetical protein
MILVVLGLAELFSGLGENAVLLVAVVIGGVLLAAHSNRPTSPTWVKAVALGAYDFYEKPVDVDILQLTRRWVRAAYGDGFELVVSRAPWLWREIYRRTDGPAVDTARWGRLAERMLFRAFHRLLVTGDLTIKAITRPLTLDLSLDGVTGDPWGGERLALTATGEIDREEYDMTWNVALETGGWLVSQKIRIEIRAQAVRAD